MYKINFTKHTSSSNFYIAGILSDPVLSIRGNICINIKNPCKYNIKSSDKITVLVPEYNWFFFNFYPKKVLLHIWLLFEVVVTFLVHVPNKMTIFRTKIAKVSYTPQKKSPKKRYKNLKIRSTVTNERFVTKFAKVSYIQGRKM